MGKGKNDEEQVDISQDMKRKVQPSQDNCDPMVKKLEKGRIVTFYKCHGEGHKFYKCPQFVKKMDKGAKKKLNPTIKSSLIRAHSSTPSPTARTRPRATPTSSRRRLMARWLHTRLGR
jgi:hypothetical protein